MKTLSVALIVKNEEKVLARILKDCGFADEIVVVDTGSTDRTIEIAKECKAAVHSFPWADDFSAARNFAFEKASSEYVMWVDADDIITPTNQQKISDWKASEDSCDTLMCKYCTGFDESGRTTFWFYRERILRNAKQAVWQGRIHEVIAPFGKISYCDIEIWHKREGEHTDRNLKIYRRMKREKEKFSERELYYYARELYYGGFYERAKTEFKRFLKSKDGYCVDKAEALKILHTIYISTGEQRKALECLFATFSHIRPRADICCLLANIYFNQNEVDKAIDWYKFALACESKEGFVDADLEKFVPYIQLCVCYDRKGKTKTAHQYHLLAKGLKPENKAVVFNEEYFKAKLTVDNA